MISLCSKSSVKKKTRVSLWGNDKERKDRCKKIQQREYISNRRKEELKFASKQTEYVKTITIYLDQHNNIKYSQNDETSQVH